MGAALRDMVGLPIRDTDGKSLATELVPGYYQDIVCVSLLLQVTKKKKGGGGGRGGHNHLLSSMANVCWKSANICSLSEGSTSSIDLESI